MNNLSEFSSIGNGSPRKVTHVRQQINLKLKSPPALQHPYWAGLKEQNHEGKEADQMVKEGVINPAMSEAASAVVFAPKKDRKSRFCVDYRKLTAMTVQNTFALKRVTKRTHFWEMILCSPNLIAAVRTGISSYPKLSLLKQPFLASTG